MTQFVVGLFGGFRDPERMNEYRAVAADALAKHGGKIVVPPVPPERIDGEAEPPAAIVLLSFPSSENARAWMGDPELASIHAMRRDGADVSLFLVEADT